MIRPCRAAATLFLVTVMNTVIPASAAEQGYDELLELFASFREMTRESGDDSGGIPQVDPAAIAADT